MDANYDGKLQPQLPACVGMEQESCRQYWLAALIACVVGCHAPGTGHNIEGVRHFQQQNPQAALQRFQQALAASPTNPDGYYNLAATYHYMGKQRNDLALMAQAESLYHQCLDLSPDHVACHRALGVLLVDSNRPRSAFTLMERWASRSPHLADARIELARLHEEFGEPRQARRYLAEAIDVNPGDARAWAAMARLREASGEYAQALNNYRQAYALNSQQPQVASRIAYLQQRVSGLGASGTRYADQVPRGWTRR